MIDSWHQTPLFLKRWLQGKESTAWLRIHDPYWLGFIE
jgi:hypothetical protein